MDICKWCKKEVDIPFEETQDKKKRTYFKGKCPSCGKTNKKWPAKTSEDIEPEVSEEIPEDIPEEIPETSQEDIEPEVSEEAIVPVTPEVITEPEDPEEDNKKKWGAKDYALIGFIAITAILVIILIWQSTKKEAGHGQEET